MTPIEKAKQLVLKVAAFADKRDMINDVYDVDIEVDSAKNIAIIMVDEIIDTDMLIDDEVYVNKPSYLNYWIDVKDEINKLTSNSF